MINVLSGIQSSAAALDAERVRMEVISQNIANANTTRGVDGKPYRRQVVVFENVLNSQQAAMGGMNSQPGNVQVSKVISDPRPFRQVNLGVGHPDADKNGMVSMPNVDIQEEMVDLIASSRTFEANLAVVKNARSMANQALSIGKR